MRRVPASWRRITIAAALACGCDPSEGESRPDGDLLLPPDDAPESREGPVAGVITPVLLVPNDRAVDQSRIDAVNGGLDDLRSWYQTQLGTHRLEMGGLQVIAGDRSAAEYREDNGIWNVGPDELRGKLGYSPWDEGHVVLVIGAGLRGWAGGGANDGGTAGFAAIGLESLTDPADCEPGADPPWWCNPTVWRGSAIHELGHALTLPHSEAPSIMLDHTDYTNRTLLDSEKQKLRDGNFTRALDGGGDEPPPSNNDWSACGSDSDCTSGWCGCNGGTDLVCLPSTDYGKQCAGWQDDWQPCGSDGECKSLWCGCNYGSATVCLPSYDYAKDCVAPTKGDWEACGADGECTSGWCGCNGGSDMVCLPNAEYPKDCV